MTAPTSTLEVIHGHDAASAALQRTRRVVLTALDAPDSAAGLARRLGISRQRLNYHLRALERRGLVECIEERRKGNCTERILRATARAFVISPDTLGALNTTAEAATDRLSAAYVIAVSARTIREVSTLDTRARQAGKRISTLTIDSEIRFATAESRAAFASELNQCVAALVARYHDDTAPSGRRFRVVAHSHPVGEATEGNPGERKPDEGKPDEGKQGAER